MFSKVLSTAAVALAASSVVSAQTFTDCNPMEKGMWKRPSVDTKLKHGAMLNYRLT